MGGWENFPMLTWDDFEWITCWDKVAWSGRTANIMHPRKGFKHQTTPISVLVTFYIQYVTNVIWSICISYTYMCMYNINIYIYLYIIGFHDLGCHQTTHLEMFGCQTKVQQVVTIKSVMTSDPVVMIAWRTTYVFRSNFYIWRCLKQFEMHLFMPLQTIFGSIADLLEASRE